MELSTVVAVLAGHLVCMGGLLLFINSELPHTPGMRPMALGAMLLGLAFSLRLVSGPITVSMLGMAGDTLMVFASLLFLVGLSRFVDESGRRRLRMAHLPALMVAYVAAYALASYGYGPQGRYVLLSSCVSLTFFFIASTAGPHGAPRHVLLRTPLIALACVTLGVSVFTGLRILLVLAWGAQAVVGYGVFQQAYYVYCSLTAVLLAPLLLWMVFLRLNAQLKEQANHDALTQLLNRHGLDAALRARFGAAGGEQITLLTLDIDFFKRINDEYGHAAGDAVLQHVARELAAHARASDIVARIGGEEFLVGCVGADIDAAAQLAERLRCAVAALETSWAGGTRMLRCTVSIGVSRPLRHASELDRALRESDQAMYRAKQGGRNRVQRADDAA